MKNGTKRIICLTLAALMLFALAACKTTRKRKSSNDGNTLLEDHNLGGDYGQTSSQITLGGHDPINDQIGNNDNQQKRDQVVHEGESVWYGDLKLTFVGQEKEHKYGYKVSINVMCEYSGNSKINISPSSFLAFADGEQIEIPYSSDSVSLTSGRSSDLWIAAYSKRGARTIEFDYVNSDYAEEWGKVTFIVDLQPSDYYVATPAPEPEPEPEYYWP